MTNLTNETDEQRIARLRAFYVEVDKIHEARREPLGEDMPAIAHGDYDGGRFDFVTSRGLRSAA